MRQSNGIVKSTCTLCSLGCGVLVHMENGRPAGVVGDPEHPNSRGRLCSRGAASLQFLDSPGRITQPLRRVGERGEGRWQAISWDEALDRVAEGLGAAREAGGPESVGFLRGAAKGYQDRWLARFANYFGSPNVTSTSNICFMPRNYGARMTHGYYPTGDIDHPPACIMVWGVNARHTNLPYHRRIQEAVEAGAKLLVVDPVQTWYAQRADVWARPRPASDLALALGLIRVMIDEELYDAEFVARWTVGLEQLREAVQPYTPEEVERLTWLPADTVRELARQYAGNGPAVIEWGNALDATINSFQGGRAISILRALGGNLGRPGGEVSWSAVPVVHETSPELNGQDAVSPQMRARRIGAEEGILPTYFSGLPQKTIAAVLTGDPYPIEALYIPGAAILQSYADSREVFRALSKVGFVAVAEQFMMPVAEMADVVLPVATYLETDAIHLCDPSPCISVLQKVAQVGEAWSDLHIYNELSRRLGFGEAFWPSETEALDYLLKPIGLTFEEFRRVALLPATKLYRDHERHGFDTPSGKVELYSQQLADWGFDPVPAYREPPESPLSSPGLVDDYPLVLTSRKPAQFHHSGGRQIPALRRAHPDPVALLNTETAAGLGIADGDWVFIENRRGRIRQKARLSAALDPRVVVVEPSWWFPERDEDVHGWAEANMNVLTSSGPPYSREIGSVSLRGGLCRVVRAG